ncbi:hypothetical protein BB560_003400 [Smittium megazygosporum]|uniref:ER membrane protein complex subunit 6 n=1 Tax=Smittium megazygosporum TaxID=133381 RepID=A0A2T9ZC28_9FUNG|nr:hypothetical protein BB560_004477 [Smittium megazygosporum]PVV02154.1 hypothetical protein BB560_003400 [Smittium megazygosporum]
MSTDKIDYEFYEPMVNKNKLLLSNIQTLTIWATGAAAGILGLTGWSGFIFFVFAWLFISSAVFFLNAKAKPHDFFKSGITEIYLSSAASSLLTYILVWTLFYGLVNIYE